MKAFAALLATLALSSTAFAQESDPDGILRARDAYLASLVTVTGVVDVNCGGSGGKYRNTLKVGKKTYDLSGRCEDNAAFHGLTVSVQGHTSKAISRLEWLRDGYPQYAFGPNRDQFHPYLGIISPVGSSGWIEVANKIQWDGITPRADAWMTLPDGTFLMKGNDGRIRRVSRILHEQMTAQDSAGSNVARGFDSVVSGGTISGGAQGAGSAGIRR